MNKITALLITACITASSLASQPSNSSQLWSDPTFQKEFLGSYGFLAGAEPPISARGKGSAAQPDRPNQS
ncbi:MAG: hypothetical protein ACJ0BK_09355 [Coraliomargaritaceae bacterium]